MVTPSTTHQGQVSLELIAARRTIYQLGPWAGILHLTHRSAMHTDVTRGLDARCVESRDRERLPTWYGNSTMRHWPNTHSMPEPVKLFSIWFVFPYAGV
jgi:hypothetical protein